MRSCSFCKPNRSDHIVASNWTHLHDRFEEIHWNCHLCIRTLNEFLTNFYGLFRESIEWMEKKWSRTKKKRSFRQLSENLMHTWEFWVEMWLQTNGRTHLKLKNSYRHLPLCRADPLNLSHFSMPPIFHSLLLLLHNNIFIACHKPWPLIKLPNFPFLHFP